MRRDRWRWIFTTFGIAVGVSAFASVVSITRSIIHAFEQSVVQAAGKAQLQVSNGGAGVGAGLIDVIGKVPGVQAASGTVQYDVRLSALNRRFTVFGILLGADHAHREAQFGAEAVRIPDAGAFVVNVDSIALSTDLLQESGWGLGTRIEVIGPKGMRSLTVRGTVAGDGALSMFAGDVGLMDSDAAQHAFGELDRFHWIDVVVDPQTNVESVRLAVERLVDGQGIVETPFGRGRRMEAMLGTLRWMLTASGVVAMLVGVFLIQHTVATAVRRRAPDLTTLRAIGATRWLVSASVLVEALVLGAVGSLAGVALGVGLARIAVTAFGNVVAAMYATIPPPPVTMTASEVWAAIGVGEGAVTLAALVPCFQLVRMRPMVVRSAISSPVSPPSVLAPTVVAALLLALGSSCLLDLREASFGGGIARLASFAASLFLATTLLVPAIVGAVSPLFLAALRRAWGGLGAWVWQQVRRHRYQTIATIGSLAAAVTFTVGMTTLLGSYRNAFAAWVAQTLAADVFVVAGSRFSLLSGPVIDPDVSAELAKVDGVEDVFPWRFLEVQYRGNPIIIQAAPDEVLARWHDELDTRAHPEAVAVSETLAERYGLGVGDRIEVPAPRERLSLRVAAITPDYLLDLGSVTLPWAHFVKHFGEQGANILFVDKRPGLIGHDLKRRIESATRDFDVMVLTSEELHELTEAMIDQSFALTTALQSLAVLITILAMINVTTAAILDRAPDFATWRAIGLERSRLVRLLAIEASILGLLAGVLGTAAGAVLGWTLVRVVAPAVAGFRFALVWPVGWVPAVVLATTVVAGATAWMVGRSRMPRRIDQRERRW